MRRLHYMGEPADEDFNPRIPCGMRRFTAKRMRHSQIYFNPRIPCGMRLNSGGCSDNDIISIHASRVGCDYHLGTCFHGAYISIHASRVGCDEETCIGVIHFRISIHASRVGCDTGRPASLTDAQFQSTHPVWDATASASRISRRSSDFNPRIPCGMRPEINVHSDDPVYFNPRIPCGMRQATSYGCIVESISIHASRVGCDLQWHCSESGFSLFQSTHPVWDATITWEH